MRLSSDQWQYVIEVFADFMAAMPEIIVDPRRPEKSTVEECYEDDVDYIRHSFENFIDQCYADKPWDPLGTQAKVTCVDGNFFINDVHIRSFKSHDKAMDIASSIVSALEKTLGKDGIEFVFNTGEGKCQKTKTAEKSHDNAMVTVSSRT